jgi:hypothetical protein
MLFVDFRDGVALRRFCGFAVSAQKQNRREAAKVSSRARSSKQTEKSCLYRCAIISDIVIAEGNQKSVKKLYFTRGAAQGALPTSR